VLFNSLANYFFSGILFAFGFLVVYTTARTLAIFYHYGPLKIGLVTLSFGIGWSVTGLSASFELNPTSIRLRRREHNRRAVVRP
jgi:hypothetical protein